MAQKVKVMDGNVTIGFGKRAGIGTGKSWGEATYIK